MDSLYYLYVIKYTYSKKHKIWKFQEPAHKVVSIWTSLKNSVLRSLMLNNGWLFLRWRSVHPDKLLKTTSAEYPFGIFWTQSSTMFHWNIIIFQVDRWKLNSLTMQLLWKFWCSSSSSSAEVVSFPISV